VLTVSSLAVAAPLTSNSKTMPMSHSTGAFGTNVAQSGKSPTTGLPWEGEYRPVFVQISNDPNARPHWNMSEADIVYEAIYWGPTYTRYSAVYSDNHPDYVGSVRSARTFHLALRQEWDCPIFFWGGQGWDSGSNVPGPVNIRTFFKDNNVSSDFIFSGTDLDTKAVPVSAVAGRDPGAGRDTLHAAIVNVQYLVENKWPKNTDGTSYAPSSHTFNFSNSPSRGQDSAIAVYIPYDTSDHFPHYTFNASTRQYERWYNGKEQFDGRAKLADGSNKRIVASNVIVQFCKLEYMNRNAQMPIVYTTGSGVMDAFIDGRHIRGKWVRNALADRTVFLDASGSEITLLPGKTFIQIVPESQSYYYTSADNAKIDINMGSDVQPDAEAFDDAGDLSEMEKMDMSK